MAHWAYCILRKLRIKCAIFAEGSFMGNICASWDFLLSMRNIFARFAHDCTSFPHAQYMCKVCARLNFFPQCTIYVQDLRKIVLLSPLRSICARFAPDCISFPNAQYMCKICTSLCFSLQCAICAQDCRHYQSAENHRIFPLFFRTQ